MSSIVEPFSFAATGRQVAANAEAHAVLVLAPYQITPVCLAWLVILAGESVAFNARPLFPRVGLRWRPVSHVGTGDPYHPFIEFWGLKQRYPPIIWVPYGGAGEPYTPFSERYRGMKQRHPPNLATRVYKVRVRNKYLHRGLFSLNSLISQLQRVYSSSDTIVFHSLLARPLSPQGRAFFILEGNVSQRQAVTLLQFRGAAPAHAQGAGYTARGRGF
jgi:hypothetical protein